MQRHYMLIDGGSAKQSSKIYSILKANDISYLDYMVATHPDADHIGGLSGALNYAKVGIVYSPVLTHDTKTFQSLLKYVTVQGKKLTVPKAGSSFTLGNANVFVLGPISYSPDEPNNNSIVLKIVYGDTSFLLTGDAEIEEEKEIIEAGYNLRSDVLKVAHHGSNNSTCYQFLKEVMPSYAVISVGKGNQYGHPTENVLSRLRDAEVNTLRTDLYGDITFSVNGSNIEIYAPKIPTETTVPNREVPSAQETKETAYILNARSQIFHYPECDSVNKMSEHNKIYFDGTRDEAISKGYKPCQRCNP